MKKERIQKCPAPGTWLRRGMLFGLIGCAGWLLLSHAAQPPAAVAVPTPAPTEAYSRRTLREQAYLQDIEAIEHLLQSTVDEDTKAQAGRRMERMIAEHQSEIAIEEALRQSGVDPALVLIQNGALTVILHEKQVQADNSASILNLCTAHTDIAAENIRIMSASP